MIKLRFEGREAEIDWKLYNAISHDFALLMNNSHLRLKKSQIGEHSGNLWECEDKFCIAFRNELKSFRHIRGVLLGRPESE